ncbi:MAG: hypothetical protein GF346_03290 [Candidatus Eisenbacteria bacterium]|nr:hypothetical protein [Candidatus Latescibacterota bacterium]MBD3301446.1 hypothetical protein [Candidatus Eisenbacteria bacterium]
MRTQAVGVMMAALFLMIGMPAVTWGEQPDYAYETMIGDLFLPRGNDIEVDESGNAYAIGSFYEDEHTLDVIVTKLDPQGNILWTRYVIGETHDYATDLALDDQNNIWVTGFTDSEDFPITPDALDAELTHREVFLMKLANEDGEILYSSFHGGDHTDQANGIVINDAGEIIVVGYTKSTDFPVVDPFQEEPNAPLYIYRDVFISKFSPAGNELLYSTYFGGYDDDTAEEVRLDSEGNIIIAGSTGADDFPLVNPIQSEPKSLFIAKLSADGQQLLFGSYFGGEDYDRLFDMEIDDQDNLYLTGSTRSIQFPVTSGSYQEEFAGEILGCEIPFGGRYNCEDGYATKLRTDGSGLVFSTYLGGDSVDEAHGITVNATGEVYVTGQTSSEDFPGTINEGLYFVSKFTPDGSDLMYTFRRFSTNTGGTGITTDLVGDVYTTGGVAYPAEMYIAKLVEGVPASSSELAPPAGSALRLAPSAPNPFQDATRLRYVLPCEGRARLSVFDAGGRRVRELVDRHESAGAHYVTWDGTDEFGEPLAAGVYAYRLTWNGEMRTGRVLLVR